MFQGSLCALITPFRDGEVDEAAIREIVDWHVAEGTTGLVPCGTTGESPVLSHEEHDRVVSLTIECAAGRIPVMAGTGSNSTREAIRLTQHARAAGADAALLVMPYYNKPTQEGMYGHFRAVHDATDLPLYIYNIPGRCVVDMSIDTMVRLAELPRIVGVKDASNDPVRPHQLRAALADREFNQLSGEDASQLAFLACGGHGTISVTANVAPRECAAMHQAWQAGNAAKALALHERLMPLHEALFVETSPGPVKFATSLLGRCSSEIRLPLVEPGPSTQQAVRAAMASLDLLADGAG
ncbi:MAG: 4-hydroxy-tetrahydrodipicolinate synthase [Rhodospirillales bacterium]|nr:4-hydroxy-tetrahydrodipicolinate synthase [Rhodospirillales bacterium]MDE0710923.1 4-hydroxy-tetrahydrodipicolinate synthase [Rhodospirillales bacterium]